MTEDANSERVAAELKTKAKEAGLWALGHPSEIGGGGLPFMDFVYLNEVIGRSHWVSGLLAVCLCKIQSCFICTPATSNESVS